MKRFDYALEYSSKSQGLEVNSEGIFKNTPILSADKARIIQTKADENDVSQTIIITNPFMRDITLRGKNFTGNGPIKFDKIVLGGQTEGDMIIKIVILKLH